MLLRSIPRFVDFLRAFDRTFRQLLGLVLDLSMQTLEDGQDRALEIFLGFEMRICDTLSIGANILEQPCNTTQVLIEVVPFFQRI